jgi:hypothetical protein
MSNPTPTNDAVLDEMLGKLGDFLSALVPPGPPPPPPPQPPPPPTLSLVSVTEQSVGIGNRRGTGMVGSFNVLALKGLQLDAVVRFQYWGETSDEAEASVAGLHGRLRMAGNELRAAGFLRVEAAGTSLSESVAAVNDFWRKTADYRVLYEFQYQDNDGAESLLAQIPVDIIDFFKKPMIVTADMIRWDKVAAPTLVVRGNGSRSRRFNALSLLAFLPGGWNGVGLVKVKTFVGGDVQEHDFPSVRDFSDAFAPAAGTVALGANSYVAGRLALDEIGFPVVLPLTLKGNDFLEVSYLPEKFDGDAVVYLRVL